ncbi:class I adenylate-forming enzyme family protein [Halalkalibacillus halophilus]|uniref:class I adenylate-forming enzyme family protein n=1 Tax=Halalkalibacillus halophilus TaxID=392827 RepID=UPI0004285FFC|nr:AMP-binding protein [Halalkalibacillus halophilus]
MNLSQLLYEQAEKRPNQEAIVSGGERITYQEWNQNVNRVANALKKSGFQHGDKLIIHLPNVSEFMYLYLAAIRLKGLAIPVNAKLTTPELQFILNHSEAKFFATHELLFEQAEELASTNNLTCFKTGEASGEWRSFNELLQGNDSEVVNDGPVTDEASILYTSGTTGESKGVLFTHENIITVGSMICEEMNVNASSKLLHMMPLSHSAPLHLFMVAGLYQGSTHVLAPTFTPDLLLETVSKEKTTHFFGAPVAYLMTAKHPEIDNYDLSSMEYWVYGGAPLGSNEVQFVKKQFQTDRLVCVYGLTEAGPNGTLLEADEHKEKAGSIGKRPAKYCEIRLVNEDGEDVQQGEPGEIALRGKGTMKGYYKAPEKTGESIKGGWLFTGDIAYQDDDGYYWVIDRKKDMIISGGVNIYPTEVEDVMKTHDHINDVAIVGVPHPEWGETAKAYVVANETAATIEEEMKQYLADKLATYKIPKVYEVIDELPRNATGKLLRNQLRDS